MGSGIAAQIANADLPVLLLDLPAKTAGQPHAAAAAIDRLLESDPPQLMHKKRAQLITTGRQPIILLSESMSMLTHWIITEISMMVIALDSTRL